MYRRSRRTPHLGRQEMHVSYDTLPCAHAMLLLSLFRLCSSALVHVLLCKRCTGTDIQNHLDGSWRNVVLVRIYIVAWVQPHLQCIRQQRLLLSLCSIIKQLSWDMHNATDRSCTLMQALTFCMLCCRCRHCGSVSSLFDVYWEHKQCHNLCYLQACTVGSCGQSQ